MTLRLARTRAGHGAYDFASNRGLPEVVMKRFALAVALVVSTVLTVTGTSDAASQRTALPGSSPPWATASARRGAAPSGDWVGFRVYLGWRDGAAAAALAQSVSDPKSASYGRYLTPGQFRQRFAPAQSDVNAVRSWLSKQGFDIGYTPSNNHYISAEGT